MKLAAFVLLACSLTAAGPDAKRYQPAWESLDARPMPEWFNEAKFGIFVVWGPYSVPAYAPPDGRRGEAYAEWYGKRMEQKDAAAREFHLKNYGEGFDYEEFADQFKAELWDPDYWADLFVRAGARYVVTTANYHDGFALWPTEYARTNDTDRWNAMVRGPRRDLLGELNEAGRKRGLRMGIYYSLYEWWHPLWLTDRERYVTEHLHPKFQEVVTRYKPPVIYLDGEWEMDYTQWRGEELAAWLFNDSPVADVVVVNDRWGNTRGLHGSYFSSEHGGGDNPPTHPWQEDRGIGKSYGYNRAENIHHYETAGDLVRLLSKVAGNGGNLLLGVGPTADGRIPVIMQDRLLAIGEWLRVNGEAIYGSRANPFWPRRFPWGTATARADKIYLHLHDRGAREISLRGLASRVRSARLLADPAARVRVTKLRGGVRIRLPETLPDEPVRVIALEFNEAPRADTTFHQDDGGAVDLHIRGMTVHGQRARVHFDGYRREAHMAGWTDPSEYLTADFIVREPGRFAVELVYSSDEASAGSEVAVEADGQRLTGITQAAERPGEYETLALGSIRLRKTGRCRLTVRAASAASWKGMCLQSVRLVPLR